MYLEDIELKILSKVVDLYIKTRRGVNNFEIAKDLKLDPEYVADILSMLEKQGYIHVEAMSGGYYVAYPEAQGRLMITHPEYMIKKLTGPIMIQVLTEVVEKSQSIPEANKKSLVSKLKDLKDDPYISGISTGLIVEALKAIVL